MKRFIQTCRILFGVLIFVAIFFQLYFLRDSSTFNLINYVSYFTVLSNFFVASVLIFSGIRTEKSVHLDFARGAATLYILVTGLGFLFLLGGKNEQLLPWVNITLHYIAPIIMLTDWVIEPLIQKIDFKRALAWIAPPLTYLGFCVARGYLTGWYPYSFLDLNKTTIEELITDLVAVSIGMIILTFILTMIGRSRTLKSSLSK